MKNFQAGKIRRSLRRFIDFAGDLSRADMNTFEDRLSLLMDYCQNDEVFRVIDQQLTSIEFVDFDAWYTDRKSTMGGMVGSGQLSFPTNLDERLSLMYQLLRKINSEEVNFLDFTNTFFAVVDSRIDSHIYAFNEAIVEPLSRELGYRFEEIEESLPENQRDTVPLANIQIIHNAHTVIQQSASGSGINQSAIIEKDNKVQQLFSDLRREIQSAIQDAGQIQEAMEITKSAEILATATEPKPAAVKALLKTLPSLGNIGSIVSAILSAIAIMS